MTARTVCRGFLGKSRRLAKGGAALSLMALLGAGCGSADTEAESEAEAAARPRGPLAEFTAREVLGRDWTETLVTYHVKAEGGIANEPGALSAIPLTAPARPEAMRLVDAASGEDVPFQLWRTERAPDGTLASARVSFRAALPAGGSYAYRLLAEAPPTPAADIAVTRTDDYLVLDNGLTAIRLLNWEAGGAEGLAFAEDHAAMAGMSPADAIAAGLAPGPVQGLRLADGRWAGNSHFHAAAGSAPPRVTAISSAVLEQGPLFAEAQVHYELDNGGFYTLTARILAGEAFVRIDEQFDTKQLHASTCPHGWPGSPPDWRVLFTLGSRGDGAWRPDHVYWMQSRFQSQAEDLETRLTELGVEMRGEHAQFGARALTFNEPMNSVADISVWYPWHPHAAYFALVDSGTLPNAATADDVPILGLVPLNAGTWRGAHGQFRTSHLVTFAHGETAMSWPLQVERHPQTLLHTGEHDPELPFSFGRRQWAYVAGPAVGHDVLHGFRISEGFIGLDQYKDWIVDWPENPKTTYPRLVFSQADVDRLKPQLDGHPAGATLRQFLYFQDEPDAARRTELWERLSKDPAEGPDQERPMRGPGGQAYHHLQFGGDWLDSIGRWRANFRVVMFAAWAHDIDELMAAGNLDAEQRTLLRRHLAALCHLATEPNFNPRGSMIHLGNPNMPINRFFVLPIAAGLIPDHPRASEWNRVSADYVQKKLAMNTAPGGAWSELVSYFGAAYQHILQAALVLTKGAEVGPLQGGIAPEVTRLAAEPSRYILNLLGPQHPRVGTRTVPGWGHEGIYTFQHWLLTAGMVRESDPDLARALAWAWQQTGAPADTYHFMHHEVGFTQRVAAHADLVNEVDEAAVKAELASAWWPGFGATLRAHTGDPNETYLSFRQGYLTSHSDANQGDFVIHAKGAPLTELSRFIYPLHQRQPYIELRDTFGWHSRVRFGNQTDDGGWPGGGPISGVHRHFFHDSVDYLRALGDYPSTSSGQAPSQRWTRQILFLKDADPAGPNYFVFRDSFRPLDGDPGSLEQTWWYQRTGGTTEQVTAVANGFDYVSEWGPRMAVRTLQPAQVAVESRQASSGPETITVNAFGPLPAGQDVFVLIYPHAADEAVPEYELLADGVARVGTATGTDYIFAAAEPFAFERDGVVFEGVAGAVRIRADAVHLVVAEGPGRVGYGGASLRAEVPAARVVPRAELDAAGEQAVAAPAHDIAFDLPAGEVETVQPGVRRVRFEGGVAYAFDSDEPLRFEHEGAVFEGLRGGIMVDDRAGTVRLVMIEGRRIGHDDLNAQSESGPYDLTVSRDHVSGRSAGHGRYLYLTLPPGIDRLPMLVIDGRTYAPGTADGEAIVPLPAGEHRFELRALPQPDVWRTWQEW